MWKIDFVGWDIVSGDYMYVNAGIIMKDIGRVERETKLESE